MELLGKCLEFFSLSDEGLVYKKWRKGLSKDCVGERVGNSHHSGYKYVKIDGKLYGEHRLVWLMIHGQLPDDELDHIDGDKSNNGIANLRLADRGKNCANRNGWSSSGYKGVYPQKRGKPWFSQITVDKELVRLGSFNCKIEAAKVYDLATLKYKGEFAKTNFPKENYQ